MDGCWDIVSLWCVSLLAHLMALVLPSSPRLSPPLPFQPEGHAEVTTCRRYVTHGWQECELCSLTHLPQTLHHCNGVPTRSLMRKSRREAPSSGVFLPHPFALVLLSLLFSFHFSILVACTLSSPPSQPRLPPPTLPSSPAPPSMLKGGERVLKCLRKKAPNVHTHTLPVAQTHTHPSPTVGPLCGR